MSNAISLLNKLQAATAEYKKVKEELEFLDGTAEEVTWNNAYDIIRVSWRKDHATSDFYETAIKTLTLLQKYEELSSEIAALKEELHIM